MCGARLSPGTADYAIYLQTPTVFPQRIVTWHQAQARLIKLSWWYKQKGIYGVIACDLYAWGHRFESWSGHRLSGQVTGVSLVPAAKLGILP